MFFLLLYKAINEEAGESQIKTVRTRAATTFTFYEWDEWGMPFNRKVTVYEGVKLSRSIGDQESGQSPESGR